MDRIALVIGNSAYVNVTPLHNPMNDANDIASILERLNFKVTKLLDASLLDIQAAVNVFLQDLDDNATGLLFYAGHGMQIDGKNYIVPVDVKLSDKARTTVSCFCIDNYLEKIAAYKGKTNICILDACRNNPFATSRGISAGFAAFTSPPRGTIIAYSTSTDCTASDGIGDNGLYTQVLKDALLIPNLKIEEMFKSVRNKVSEISRNTYGEEQLSWEYSSLVGDFYFSVSPQPVNGTYSDQEIYDYICERQRHYEAITEDIYDIECMPYVDAYRKYKIPVIKLLRAYSRISQKKNGTILSDATIDQINITYLKSWHFEQEFGRWYYKKHYVEMGDLLPLPPELDRWAPIEGQELKIGARITSEIENGTIKFNVFSNIPRGTPLILSLKGHKYFAQCKTIAGDHCTSSEYFSDKGSTLRNGFYTLSITCPISSLLPESVRHLFGERGRNLVGKYIKFEPIGGNTISFSYGITKKESSISVIDMQKSMSELMDG